MDYQKIEVSLSPAQLKQFQLAMKNDSAVGDLLISKQQVQEIMDGKDGQEQNNFMLLLTTRQIAYFDEAFHGETSLRLAFSRHQVQSMKKFNKSDQTPKRSLLQRDTTPAPVLDEDPEDDEEPEDDNIAPPPKLEPVYIKKPVVRKRQVGKGTGSQKKTD